MIKTIEFLSKPKDVPFDHVGHSTDFIENVGEVGGFLQENKEKN